ncbi:MAG: hypothetical protein WCK00_07480 [Deltaproteobacteria bacterium]
MNIGIPGVLGVAEDRISVRLKLKIIWQNAKGETRLTIAERKRILTTHIYGVDIDRQAVETTKPSLLLGNPGT